MNRDLPYLALPFVHLFLLADLSGAASPAQGAAGNEMVLYAGKPLPSWHVTVAGFESPEQVLRGDALTLPKPADSNTPKGMVAARAGQVAGKPGALTLEWNDAWYAGLRLDGGAPLDLRGYTARGTLEFDINVQELSRGGIYFTMRCGPDCNRKVPYILPARALQGKGWQRLSFPLSCFARAEDDFSKVSVPFALDGNGAGKVAVANVKLVRNGKPNAACPDYRTEAVTPAPLGHAWALGNWLPRHERKLEEVRKLKAEGRDPQLIFIGDSITEGWENTGLPVWKRYYEQYNAVGLGFGGDHTENVLWRLRNGEVDGIAPKVAVLMIGTNNAGDRQDDPKATAAGVKAILDELRRRLPATKVLLLAVFPREEQPSAFLRRLNTQVNDIIAGYADGRNVFYADINPALLNADGTLSRDVMPDLLHLSEHGYGIWARSMAPALDSLMSEHASACAAIPAPRTVEYPWMSKARWNEMHQAQAARAAQGGADVMFVGDSLTEMWPKPLWDANFGHLKAANFGIGGDRTGNVLWRLQHPAIAALKPKVVVLMIGVNNINLCGETPEQVFGGIQAVVGALRKQYPDARILLNAVLPEGAQADAPERRSVLALNRLVKTLDDGKAVFFHDYGARFVGADGALSARLQPDFLHLSEPGYRILAEQMGPDIARLLAMPQPQPPYTVLSPDGRTRLELSARDGKLSYSVSRDGATVIAPSPLGLATSLGPLDGGSLQVAGVERKTVDEVYRPVAGKAASVADRYSQVELQLAGKTSSVKLNLIARAYDDGVAFRYVLPQQAGNGKDIEITSEATGFHFPADYQCWGFNPGRHENSHEGEFDSVPASAIRPAHLFDAPLVCKTGVKQTTFAIAEADKRNYAGAYYSGRGEGGLGVQVALSPLPHGGNGASWTRPAVRASLAGAPLATPWRVVMLADTPGGLAASSLIATLGSPSAIGDTSWIKPGKAAWDWWNGWAAGIPDAGVNTATYRAYIDFAAAMGLEYILIDEGWYEGSSETPAPANVLKPVPQMDMPAIVAYARGKGIGVWAWLQWKQLDRQMDEALALYQSWGLKGIKVDFMDRNDQEMVGYYHRLLGKAAAHRLMVNLHGAYPPDGLARTYPNYMTQEGVLGAEYNKWSKRITATHNVTLPFTRMILGPIDYTPGGFRSLPPEQFPARIRSARPFVQTTRGQAVAMYVVYDSPLAMVADSPDAYRNADGSWADGAAFIGKVPTSWDETRVIDGDIGQFIVTARRKGDKWYLGAMTNERPRTLQVPLSFMRDGVQYRAEILQDGKDATHLHASEEQVTAASRIRLALAGSGGAVVVLTPVPAAGQDEGARQARANFARPVVLAADDTRAFAPPPAGFADAQPGVPQGRVEEFSYDSAVTGTRRKASVYLPPGYTEQRRYPVLYLLHGIGGNQDEWRGYVRAPAILDQLIASGKAVPMIVVMPNGRALPDDRPPPAERTFTPAHVEGFARFEHELLETLVPAVERRYAAGAGPRQRAIAGLSMGGGQALNFGLGHLDSFAWVGAFSAAPNTRTGPELLPDPALARARLALLYLSCGSKDGLISVSQGVHRHLGQQGVAHVWNVDEYGHDRESWAENLYHFAQRLFR